MLTENIEEERQTNFLQSEIVRVCINIKFDRLFYDDLTELLRFKGMSIVTLIFSLIRKEIELTKRNTKNAL
jgi:hypothetical protein